MVGIRWATVTTVHLLVSSLILLWITLSVAVSTDAVASSKTNIFLLCSSTLARHTSCLCPILQFSPSSSTEPIHQKFQEADAKRLPKFKKAKGLPNAQGSCYCKIWEGFERENNLFSLSIPGMSRSLWSCLTISSRWHFPITYNVKINMRKLS